MTIKYATVIDEMFEKKYLRKKIFERNYRY